MINELNNLLSSGVPPGVYAEVGLVNRLSQECQAVELLDVGGMPLQRRNEFIAGRGLVRRGLASFGIPDCRIGRAEDGSPVWPPGVCGSISHKRNLCAVVLSHTSAYHALGVDIEKDQNLSPTVWKYFVNPQERMQSINEAFDRIANLLFSCKEAAYKCLQPQFTAPVPFEDILVHLTVKNIRSYQVRSSYQGSDLEGELYRWNDVVLVWMTLRKKIV